MPASERPSSPSHPADYWRKCTTCKTPIGFGGTYWVCSVSTCNRQRTGLVFCDIRCFDAHVPVLNHRDAGAFERRAPTQAQVALSAQGVLEAAEVGGGSPKVAGVLPTAVPRTDRSAARTMVRAGQGDEILVVVSKVKDYIRAKSGMNTSDSVMAVLSSFVRKYSDQAIQSAQRDRRKTVLDRDF